jgi:hypothetical protein
MSSTELSGTLQERNGTHGDYHVQSSCTEYIESALRTGRNWDELPAFCKHALKMVSVKLGRILSGDWSHVDHWHDIQGYAGLVEKQLIRRDSSS